MTARAPAAAGLRSRTRLVFALRAGRTVLAVRDLGAPLKAIRPFPLADGRALLQLISAAPGLFGGDDYELDIEVEPGARALVVAASAAKLHSMVPGARARQTVRLRVAEGASLEYHPGRNIPFPQADYEQVLQASVDPRGRLALVESWAMGRLHRGERFLFRRLSARTAIDRAGQPLYRDALELAPSAGRLPEQGLLEGAHYCVAGVWCGPAGEPSPEPSIPFCEEDAVLGPFAPGCWYLRGLFRDGLAADDAVRAAQAAADAAWSHSSYDWARFAP